MKQESTANKIGKYLKYQRQKRGLSLVGFAKLTSLDPSFIHRVEKGYYNGVSFDAIEKMATGLNMTVEVFLAKCQITPTHCALPSLEFYFKEHFQFPESAIRDVELFISFLQEKYKAEIAKMKAKHDLYWNSNKKKDKV